MIMEICYRPTSIILYSGRITPVGHSCRVGENTSSRCTQTSPLNQGTVIDTSKRVAFNQSAEQIRTSTTANPISPVCASSPYIDQKLTLPPSDHSHVDVRGSSSLREPKQ